MNKDVIFKNSVNFLKNAKGKVGIFFDMDCDGVCSGAITLAFLKKLKGVYFSLNTGNKDDYVFEAYGKEKVDFAIFLDYAFDELKFLKPFVGKCLVVDHHPPAIDFNKKGFVFWNPRLFDKKAYISTSHNIYDITKATGFEGFEWLMKLGAIGDHEIEGTKLEIEAVDTINAVKAMDNPELMINLCVFLSNASGTKDVIENPDYMEMKKKVSAEIEKQIAVFSQLPESKLSLFQVKSRVHITSILSTKLSDLYPKRAIILYSKSRDGYRVSGRAPNKNIDLGKVFKSAARGIGKGGGHPVAAGAKVSDIELFLKRVRKHLVKHEKA
ncbi:MAG: DHH family phosphoesterase [Candidatus Aenigmarchaeota archaeon]|nr:DHH family phosphoesterase [Candidatus Aenigmarchaeota archaeon]